MGRVGGLQLAGLTVALLLVGYGAYAIVLPRAEVVRRPPPLRYGYLLPSGPEYVSRRQSRLTGFLSVGFGAGIAGLALSIPGTTRRFGRDGRPRTGREASGHRGGPDDV